MKNKVKREYQMTTLETQDRKWHTSRGSGPNHILKLVIPHTIIPYKAPLKMIKRKQEDKNKYGRFLFRIIKIVNCQVWNCIKIKF